MHPAKLADTSVVGAVFIWFLANLGVINSLLQFFLLITSLVGVFFAIRYHRRNTPRE